MADPSEAKNITNINYNCLERIFDFLELKSLLNVARTCKRLQIAAAAKFGDEYGKHYFELDPTFNAILENPFNLIGKNECLPFLRCFGSKISNLWIMYDDCLRRFADTLNHYINTYCADSLTSITVTFMNDRTSPNEIFQKPFRNVVKVSIMSILNPHIKVHLPKLVNSFPNVRSLKICLSEIDQTTVETHFPHLEHLKLELRTQDSLSTNENAAKFLRSNKQLQSLEIFTYSGTTFSTLSHMISGNPTLSELSDMISGNPSILKLEVYSVKVNREIVTVTKAEIMRFASEHPNIIELYFRMNLSADDVIVFLGQLKSLKKFNFHVKERPECDRILNQLGNEWQHNVTDNRSLGFEILLNR